MTIQKDSFKIDLRISIVTIVAGCIALISNIIYMTWFVQRLENRLTNVEKAVVVVQPLDRRVLVIETELFGIKEKLISIDKKLDKALER